MTRSTSLLKVPFDYKKINWENIKPDLIIKSAIAHYKNYKTLITQLETDEQTDDQYLQNLDTLSSCCGPFNQLISFLLTGGKTEFRVAESKVRRLHIQLHYQIFSNNKIYARFLRIDRDKIKTEDLYYVDIMERSFKDSGVKLNPFEKKTIKENNQELNKAQMKFSQNIVKSQNKLKIMITKKEFDQFFNGIVVSTPLVPLSLKKKDYYVLDEQLFTSISINCSSAKIRKRAYDLYHSVATKGKENNNNVIKQILKLEKIAPKLLGYKSINHFMLSDRILNHPKKVEDFLNKIHKEIKPIAYKEVKILEKVMGNKLNYYDVDYAQRKHREKLFNIDYKEINKYFSWNHVFSYILKLNKDLFGIEFTKSKVKSYHKDILIYEMFDTDTQKHIGLAYFDILSRKNKETGAWATELHYNKETNEHVVSFAANIDSENTNYNEIFLDIDEVRTLFHEMGHLLHFVCPKHKFNTYSSEYVEWDFVELPSQLYEQWLTQPKVLQELSCHYKTNKKLDLKIINKLLESNNLFKALDYQYHTAKSFLDILVHKQQNIKSLRKFENTVFKKYLPIAPSKKNFRLASLSHLFGGGYDVGLYSYVFANVLDSNAWNVFLKHGIKNPKIGRKFKKEILCVGASSKAEEQIKNFIGEIDIKVFIDSF